MSEINQPNQSNEQPTTHVDLEQALDIASLKKIIEAILFSTDELLSVKELKNILKDLKGVKTADVQTALNELVEEHKKLDRSFQIVEVADKYKFATKPEYGPWVRKFHHVGDTAERLTQPALETLAILAYRQPLTKVEIEDVRGVSVDYVLKKLLELGLIEVQGRKEILGHPFLYGTTEKFLQVFGLKNLGELPRRDELILKNIERSFKKTQGDNFQEKINRETILSEINPSGESELDQPAMPETPQQIASESQNGQIQD